jgi:hypothetical protein
MMSTLLRSIAQLRRLNTEFDGVNKEEMPLWMGALLAQMERAESDVTASLNRRLIIARLVYNLTQQERRNVLPTVAVQPQPTEGSGAPAAAAPEAAQPLPTVLSFERYAKQWARPLLRLVFDSLLNSSNGSVQCFHYLARDLLCLVTEWQRASVASGRGDTLPDDEESSDLLTELVEKLMGMCGSRETVESAASSKDLIRENVRIVKLLIESWAGRIRIRRFILNAMMTARFAKEPEVEMRNKLTAIHLLDVVLQNNLSAYDDPEWKPRVRCSHKKDPSGWTLYEPVAFETIPRALLELVRDHRPPKPGATGAAAGVPASRARPCTSQPLRCSASSWVS